MYNFKDASGKPVPYCYDTNVLEGSVAYESLRPDTRYVLMDGSIIQFPNTYLEGSVRVVTTLILSTVGTALVKDQKLVFVYLLVVDGYLTMIITDLYQEFSVV